MAKRIQDGLTITAGAEIIRQKADAWSGKGSIYTLTVNAAKKLSKDKIFNMAAWLMFNYGPLYSGENDADWLKTAKDLLKIAKVSV